MRMGYANIACCSGWSRHTLMLSENGEVQRNTTPWIPSQLKAANVFPRTHALLAFACYVFYYPLS
jgi:hypothetical protein